MRLFLRKSRVGRGCSVSTRSENAVVRFLAVESHENWIEAIRYLNMEPLEEQKKERLRMAAVA